MAISIKITSDPKEMLLRRALKKFGPHEFDIRVREAMDESMYMLRLMIRQNFSRDTGHAIATLESEVYGAPQGEFSGLTGIPLLYAAVIDATGRQPGSMPPYTALEGWAQRRAGDASLAYVIARGIGRNGISPRHSFEKIARDAEVRVHSIFRKWLWNEKRERV